MACADHCNGHGLCVNGMMCLCDHGYAGESCVAWQQHPTYLKEDFAPTNNYDGPRRGDVVPSSVDSVNELSDRIWLEWSGGQRSKECGEVFTDESLLYANTGDRVLVTKVLDLARVSMVQFYIKLGCTLSDGPSLPIMLQYSVNGGINWHSIEQFNFNPTSRQPEYFALHLPSEARLNATQLRWWQPSKDGTFLQDWAIDQIYVGGDIYGERMLRDDPGNPRDATWLMFPGGAVEKVCNSKTDSLHFNGVQKMRYAMSADVDVTEGTFLQFDIVLGCDPQKRHCYGVILEFSLDMGKSWSWLQRACLPSNVDCSTYYSSSQFMSDIYSGWNTVTLQLPYYTRSKNTRFRWRQPDGFRSHQSWALAHLYIGAECTTLCHGRGRCVDGQCVCSDGWSGDECSLPTELLPGILTDDFTEQADGKNWLKLVGGKVAKPCIHLASGQALHFTGSCSRTLITRDLDLREAMLIQFYFMFGCNSLPLNRDQSVLVDYSTNSGITWHTITELYFNLYRHPTFISLKLPEGAHRLGVTIRWWQPHHGGSLLADWLIDSLRINGAEDNPTSLHGNESDNFPTTDNVELSTFCGANPVFVGSTNEEASVLTSRELQIRDGSMLQFDINVGCGVLANASVSPVVLEYSTDHGVTWSGIYPKCSETDRQCQGDAQMPSVFYGDVRGQWQRVVTLLHGMPVSNATRFRWIQRPTMLSVTSQWGIQHVYIGPACDDYCSGHGRCDYPQCICDYGYDGENCNTSTVNIQTQMKDTFDVTPGNHIKWPIIQSGEVKEACSVLVEGTALTMDGPGLRQAVTQDLDLRNAKFLQYTAMIGGQSVQSGCYVPSSRGHNVLLEFSTNGGISWNVLHILDYETYLFPHTDYLPLPKEARTGNTRFRWWQPLAMDGKSSVPLWALDNVFIGGTEINPSQYVHSFNNSMLQDDTSAYEFSPHGKIEDDVCSKQGSVLSYHKGLGVRMFTTNQLIVQRGYMLQFNIVVGCKHFNICEDHIPVGLEYNKNPRIDRWQLVRSLCLPDSERMECHPQVHHQATIYHPSDYPSWSRVTIELPNTVFSGSTRFRWIQSTSNTVSTGWALGDIYVGEKCEELCRGRGDCIDGRCICDPGYYGSSCQPNARFLPRRLLETFEGGIHPSNWETVTGGGIGFGCGALLPYAHGKTLYFNNCGTRQAVTAEMDLTSAVKIIFVMQIGCRAQTIDCNVKLGRGANYRGVLLQYSADKGSSWRLLARHDPEHYMNPRRVAYDVPTAARVVGVQIRWWQPVHDGAGFDQWAIDKVEIISGKPTYRRRRLGRSVGE